MTLSTAKIIAPEMPECVWSFGTVILTGEKWTTVRKMCPMPLC